MSLPMISVIIPVYNASEFLKRAVSSVCLQESGQPYEIILVDDGSTDGSAGLCDELSQEYEHIRVIHKQNGGVSTARNVGLDEARGDYVMFLDADDVICDWALDKLYNPELDFVLGGFEKLDSSLSSYEKYIPKGKARYLGKTEIGNFLDDVIASDNTYLLNSACSKLYRRSIIEQHYLRFIEGLHYAEDKMFVMSYLRYVNAVGVVSYPVYGYIVQPGSLSSDMKSDSHIGQVLLLLKEYAPLLEELLMTYPDSLKLKKMYHKDFIGRYVCRILTLFAQRKSSCLTDEIIEILYGYMDRDSSLGLFSVRLGQVPNILLYKIRNIAFSIRFYKFCVFCRSFWK